MKKKIIFDGIIETKHAKSMEIKESKQNSTRRVHKSVPNNILVFGPCLMTIVCLVVNADLQDDLQSVHMVRQDAMDMSYDVKPENDHTDKNENVERIEKHSG